MPSFLGGKSRGAFGQPALFLAGNGMTTVAFKKRESSACLTKRFSSREVKFRTYEKYEVTISGKKEYNRVLSCLFRKAKSSSYF